MTRTCSTCQHVKRAEIDRRLAAGEPGNQIARDYQLNASSLHRHRTSCLRLGSSNAIMKEVARGSAALACLPSKGTLYNAYAELQHRIDAIVNQAQQEGSLTVAISGLNSVRHTLDSMMRLAGHDRPPDKSQAHAPAQAGILVDVAKLAGRLMDAFDGEPDLKARIARALLDTEPAQDAATSAASAGLAAPAADPRSAAPALSAAAVAAEASAIIGPGASAAASTAVTTAEPSAIAGLRAPGVAMAAVGPCPASLRESAARADAEGDRP